MKEFFFGVVGVFDEGVKMIYLGEEGDWVKVRMSIFINYIFFCIRFLEITEKI